MRKVHLVIVFWQYNNMEMKITNESNRVSKEITGANLKDVMDKYGEAKNNHDLSKYSPMHIEDIWE